ncbi:hypothetical protein COV15_01100 [Candidatus Woesearchaeota archaeon CG10_big_fil_rev_8_21_14_0_10_34_12]|nr:MAG: hypothetical protein COV15_01100 [Candidatus Woesearchaeota archaeon CG10_big_fil_rev_8_21_14_0_10_34_12]
MRNNYFTLKLEDNSIFYINTTESLVKVRERYNQGEKIDGKNVIAIRPMTLSEKMINHWV